MVRIAILIMLCIGFAGCASRRCCRCTCNCHQQQQAPAAPAPELAAFPTVTPQPIHVEFRDYPEQDQVPADPSPVVAEIPQQEPATQFVAPEVSSAKSTKPIAEISEEKPELPADQPAEIVETKPEPKFVPRTAADSVGEYGHAEDYSWVKGQLHRVHVPGVEWKIRYLPLDKADQWGGSMVLAPNIQLEDFEHLDFVYLEGVQMEERPSLYTNGPLYRITKIRRANQE